ncbi:A disintegrin and metalloproteinase with thrombospondin motifs 7 isoform X1 [Ochlerotatus camptorhynchus]|uniref:A disintegrin and metalloproteinase with thrombospondin motifs 7 isoform X1 n=1 Tax=Ochlerotatus camptorhynchus TaxID=644619 RepID=UPI0031DF2D47
MFVKNSLLQIIATLLVAVHNSGVISGTFMNNGAVRCGTSVCRPVSAIYTKSQQTSGYVHVATIPAGVYNITVTELQNSQNYLVLKTADHQRFIINGDFTISLSGFYLGAGTTFEYRRVDGLNNGTVSSFRKIEGVTEWVTAPGPTNEAVELYVLSQQPNPGIKYEYLMPINTNPNLEQESSEDNRVDVALSNDITEKASFRVPKQRTILNNTLPSSTSKPLRKRKFLWKVVGFSACSKSCGGGIQQPIIKCVREAPTRVFSPKRCAHLAQPVLNEHLLRCNTQPCPAYWKLSEWSECDCEHMTTDNEAYKTREVKCVQELISGIVIQVNSGACMEEQPPANEKCDCTKHSKPPQMEAHQRKPTVVNHHHHHHNNHHNGHNTQNDMQITNGYGRTSLDASRINQQVEAKKTGVWITADWSERCSATCGVGLQTRSIFCDRSASTNAERCDLRFTPDTTRECTSNRACEYGEWFAGPWGLCSGDCFNLTRSRTVLCIRNDNFATDSECNDNERPVSMETCDTEAIDDCKPRWHYSEWSECTKTCDSGNQRRVVKCLEFNLRDKVMQESASCRYADRPMAYRVCNEEPCPSTTTSSTTMAASMESYVEPRVDMIQNDGTCRDDFPNCSIVLKAKLCSYAYYSQACCQTCRNRSNELY